MVGGCGITGFDGLKPMGKCTSLWGHVVYSQLQLRGVGQFFAPSVRNVLVLLIWLGFSGVSSWCSEHAGSKHPPHGVASTKHGGEVELLECLWG